MEKWKLAAIAALLCSFAGYGVFANSSVNRAIPSGNVSGPSPSVKATPSPWLGKTLPAWPNITQWVNTPAPANLNTLKGKPVLLEVFRIECPHCQEAAPFIAALNKRYAPRGVKFIGIQSPGDFKDPQNPENSWPNVQSWTKERSYTWPVGFDAQSTWFQGHLGKHVLYPSLFLLDPQGKVVFFQDGHDTGKGIQLAVELERIAPGQGDLNARSSDLTKWLAGPLQMTGAGTDPVFQQEVLSRLREATTPPLKQLG